MKLPKLGLIVLNAVQTSCEEDDDSCNESGYQLSALLVLLFLRYIVSADFGARILVAAERENIHDGKRHMVRFLCNACDNNHWIKLARTGYLTNNQ